MLHKYLKNAFLLIASQMFAYGVQAQTLVDVAVGKHNGCALYDSGGVWCWGAEILPECPGEEPLPLQRRALTVSVSPAASQLVA